MTILNAGLKNCDGIVTPVQFKASPGSLNWDIVEASDILMWFQNSSVNIRMKFFPMQVPKPESEDYDIDRLGRIS